MLSMSFYGAIDCNIIQKITPWYDEDISKTYQLAPTLEKVHGELHKPKGICLCANVPMLQ